MMRAHFNEQLNFLETELITMGALCEEAIAGCVKYLTEGDSAAKEIVLEAYGQTEKKERDIEGLCMRLLMQQQPVAGDLRRVSSALKMIRDMEKIGRQAFEIAEIVKHMTRRESEEHIRSMAQETIKMVTDSVQSFVKKDEELARSVIEHDFIVDDLFRRARKSIIEAIRRSGADAEEMADMLMIAKYFERIGDHAEALAKQVIYSVTGNRT